MGLALQREYQEQLRLVQEEIGFRYIRGHGLFCDDMAIYQEYTDESGERQAEYNFTYLDMVMDAYRELSLRPFLELGFMPEKLASGSQTVFAWKGNVTPPKSYEDWGKLVRATLRHLMERYGAEEVCSWPIEVWNEPNLDGFWKDADMDEYFRLFQVTFEAVKTVDPRFRVGGPALCGIRDQEWLSAFLEFCRKEKIPLDFATRHHYCIEAPVYEGRYGYCELRDPDESLKEIHASRKILDSFAEYKGLEFHLTEFNTSYSSRTPVHDTNRNAAYIAYLLSRLGEEYDSYSYWTFGDIFEESGVPFTPFHGGFGLVANGGIPKPTFWTFQFYKQLKGNCVHFSEEAVVVRREDGSYCGVAWNLPMKSGSDTLHLRFDFPARQEREYCLLTKLVDEAHGNPLKLWHDMGEPATLTGGQKKLLRQAAAPYLSSRRLEPENAEVQAEIRLDRHAVLLFELFEVSTESDRGYSYQKAARFP
jgi:xylan 1,4-beta-xylosidase